MNDFSASVGALFAFAFGFNDRNEVNLCTKQVEFIEFRLLFMLKTNFYDFVLATTRRPKKIATYLKRDKQA